MQIKKTIYTNNKLPESRKFPKDATFIVDKNIPEGTAENPMASLDYIKANYAETATQIISYRPTKGVE